MATPSKPAAGSSKSRPAAPNSPTATEKESDAFLNRETSGQVLDEDNSGQQMADQLDDSSRSDYQASAAPAPASADNLPSELTDPSEAAFTLPEMHQQGRRLTTEGDSKK